MKTKNKFGFTLLEMIVVIAIIGTLLGIVLTQFGGATESAKAAQCEANLKNLATAMHSCAAAQQDGFFPPAGSFWYREFSHKGKGGVTYPRRVGWISGSEGNEEGQRKFDPIPFYDNMNPESKNGAFYAVTNGARGEMWREVKTQNSYMCPIHAAAARKKNKCYPGWSYVLNREFGMQDDSGEHWWGQTLTRLALSSNSFSPDHSKVLMFAELQGIDIDISGYEHVTANLHPSLENADAILDYKRNECMGFNHMVDKRMISGHVAFADGHVEKFNCPKSDSPLNRQTLTQALCRGHDISTSGKGKYIDNTKNDNWK